jgi:hypothetical protein
MHCMDGKLMAPAEMSVDTSNNELSMQYQYLQTPTGLHQAIIIWNTCSLMGRMGSKDWINLGQNRISDRHLRTR